MNVTGLACGGEQFDVDVIVMATGFKPFDITTEIDIAGAVERMKRENIVAIDPRRERVDAFSQEIEQRFKGTTHGKGCSSWWFNEAGVNHSIWPASTVEYRLMLADIDLADFDVVRTFDHADHHTEGTAEG